MKKISEWLDTLSSHVVYTHKTLSEQFQRETGIADAWWPTHTVAAANATYGKFKGLEQPIDGDPAEALAYGWEVAEALAKQFANSHTHQIFHGRGSRFEAALKALSDIGK